MIRACGLILGCALLAAVQTGAAAEQLAPAVKVRVTDEALNPVSERLFGQFLERASFGEPGPEAVLVPGTARIRRDAVALIEAMEIPVIRFPGGTDVDYLDWRDMVDNVPGRVGGRPISYGVRGDPITNRFGIDEYFALRDTLGNETILVVNLLDAVSRKVPLRDAALRAAGLVAYANAPVGAALPEGMPDWPAVRVRNGHAEPYGVEFVQLGNESWMWPRERLVDENGQPMDAAAMAVWMRDCLAAFIAEIRAVDPDIRIIVDGKMPLEVERHVLGDPAVRRDVEFAAFHRYEPGPMARLKRDGEPVPPGEVGRADWWRAWTAMPGQYGPDGLNLGNGDRDGFARDLGYRIAVTEWNWNGWETDETRFPESLRTRDWLAASGIGAAGFLHGLMRSDVAMATQSMLLGAHWNIAAVKLDPTGEEPPRYSPQAQIVGLYRHHHGDRRLRIETSPLPSYAQPLHMGWMHAPSGTVAFVEILATRSAETLYLHVVNRDSDRGYPLEVNLSAFPSATRATVRTSSGRSKTGADGADDLAGTSVTALSPSDREIRTVIPAASVSIIEIGLTGD